MPSQGSQPLSQSSPLCLALLKFSYATVSNDNVVPIPWIHLSSKNALFAIFETSSVQLEDGRTAERQKFKVLKDPEIMEELDLNALSVEAHRALGQAPNVSSAHIPVVAIIVKVPMIAIKYPLANGQVRRFQIRFGKNEDYYEAMKMLARANVPTVEAGTFPSLKPQPAPQSAPANIVAPDDSASQSGRENGGTRSYVPNDAMPSFSGVRHAPVAPPPPAPPQLAPTTVHRPGIHSTIQSSAVGAGQTSYQTGLRPLYPKSNISLTTATTLVPGKQDSRPHAMPPNTPDTEGNPPHRSYAPTDLQYNTNSATTQPGRIFMPSQEFIYDVPSNRQQVPAWSAEQEPGVQPSSMRTAGKPTARTQQTLRKAQMKEAEVDEPEASTKTTGKGKGKRGAASNPKKAPPAKKPRATASTKKKGTAVEKESRVATVEELLKRPEYSLLPYNPDTKARTKPRAKQINQQEGFNQSKRQGTEVPESEFEGEVRHVVSPELGHVTTRRITRSVSRALSEVSAKEMNRQRGKFDVSNAAAPPCTPADQIIGNPLTPASTGGPAYSPLSDPRGSPQPQHSHGGPSENTLAVQQDPLLAIAQQCMTMDENFDLSNSKFRLEAWTKLPAPTQLTALNNYLCGLIMDDNFVELVKDMSLFWEGAILEGRVNRKLMRSAAVGADDEVNENEEEEEL